MLASAPYFLFIYFTPAPMFTYHVPYLPQMNVVGPSSSPRHLLAAPFIPTP